MLLPLLADTTDVVTRAAVVEGYNTNVYQSQDDPNVPVIRRHPAPFTGVDADVELRLQTNPDDTYILRVEANAQHYTPLNGAYQSDDGAVNAGLAGRTVIAPRTFVTLTVQATLATLNGSHIADTTLFTFDPTLVRRTYWLATGELAVTHELSPTWRLRQGVGVLTSGTVYQPPDITAGGQLVQHRGLDYVMPFEETDLFKDFSDRATGDLLVLYQYSYNLYVLDLTQTPPRNIGPDKQAFLTVTPGYTYHFSPELSESTRAGFEIASAPPRDPDQRAVLSPTFLQSLSYTREFFSAIATASYTYGAVNPRLGAGPTAGAGLLLTGTPYHHGTWKNLSLLANGQATYATLLTGVNESTKLGLYVADVEMRYALGPWLGLLAGYQVRYGTFNSTQFVPPFLQHVVFFGLSGYWSTNRDIPALTTFMAPITPK